MKFCPTCQTEYDEEILRFCTKDGTPLLEKDQPKFTELPSEIVEEDDISEDTVIRRKSDTNKFDSNAEIIKGEDSERIVIPTSPQPEVVQQVRTRSEPTPRRPIPPPKANTGKIVALSILGTLIILTTLGILFMFISNKGVNQNENVNTDFNVLDENDNANADANADDLDEFDFNINTNGADNVNLDLNLNSNNSNLETPTPKPTITPTATPTATPTPDEPDENTNSATSPTPTATRTPLKTPTPATTQTPLPPPPTPAVRPRISPSQTPKS